MYFSKSRGANLTTNKSGLDRSLLFQHLTYVVLLLILSVLPFIRLLIYASSSKLLIPVSYVSDTLAAAEERKDGQPLPSTIQSGGETRMLLCKHNSWLRVTKNWRISSACLGILLYFPWQFVFATRGIHCLHAECRVEFGMGMCMYTPVHTHTPRFIFFSTLCICFSFFYLLRQCSDIQVFQKPDSIHAQLNYFILHSVSSWKLTIGHFSAVFDPTSSVMVFFQMFPSWVAITKRHSTS